LSRDSYAAINKKGQKKLDDIAKKLNLSSGEELFNLNKNG